MFAELDSVNAARTRTGDPVIDIGIGVNFGRLIVGTVGGPGRMDGTVIADAVNLASRVEGLTKRYGARVLLTDATRGCLAGDVDENLRRIGRIRVKGKEQPATIYEALQADLPDRARAKITTIAAFEEGLRGYESGAFRDAVKAFSDVLSQDPVDVAAQRHRDDCAALVNSETTDWAGVLVMATK